MKNLALLFARRYLRSARSLSVINTTATVSSVAIGVAVAAMVILMSVYNGFDGLLQQITNTTEPDLVVAPARGKSFEAESLNMEGIVAVEGVVAASPYVEESVMAEYRGRQMVATLRGVGGNYTDVVPLSSPEVMWYGEWKLTHGDFRRAVVGRDIDNIFGDGYSAKNPSAHDMLTLHALRRENISPLVPMAAIKSKRVRHAGTLGEGTTSLGSHIFTSLDWAQELLSLEGRLSGVVVDAEEGAKLSRVKRNLQAAVGDDFSVKSRYELNEAVYKATKAEKWAIFFILLLVTIIAAATIVGSLVMLVGEKQNDIATLYSMGARRSFVARVFTLAGLFIGGRGVVGGVLGGVVVCLVQICFGVVKMPGSTFLVENYPVEIAAGDIIGIVVAVMAVTWLLTNFTISRMVPRVSKPNEARI
ncbi:MAG: ABC transporter permease [Tidjanibacter sp.]|nr:ABC transporter permease [Tidjanibacter sp.]